MRKAVQEMVKAQDKVLARDKVLIRVLVKGKALDKVMVKALAKVKALDRVQVRDKVMVKVREKAKVVIKKAAEIMAAGTKVVAIKAVEVRVAVEKAVAAKGHSSFLSNRVYLYLNTPCQLIMQFYLGTHFIFTKNIFHMCFERIDAYIHLFRYNFVRSAQ